MREWSFCETLGTRERRPTTLTHTQRDTAPSEKGGL